MYNNRIKGGFLHKYEFILYNASNFITEWKLRSCSVLTELDLANEPELVNEPELLK